MENGDKAKFMDEHFTSYKAIGCLNKLGVYKPLIECFEDKDFDALVNVYFNFFFGPASNNITKVAIPQNASLISIDLNIVKQYPKEEMIAMILHEIGHALNGNDEYIADAFAIKRGYGAFLKTSLEKFIKDFPKEFDKQITHERITRINANLKV